MPLLPTGLSSLNQKVESARKTFNSSLDKAGEKTGVFKPTTTEKNQQQQQQLQQPQRLPPPRHQPSSSLPPPPPPRRTHPPPAAVSHQPPPPPVSAKPSTPYRPPPESLNGYGPPSFPPVQPSSRYGPPSPPRSPQAYSQPPLPIPSSKPTYSSKPAGLAFQPKTPARSVHPPTTGQIPFPPFSQFTHNDKHAFFEMLDEFFGRKFPDRCHDRGPMDDLQPPTVSLHTRPAVQDPFETDDPGPSRAESLARYFKSYHQWARTSDEWYTSDDPVPTPEQGSEDLRRMSGWSQTGNARTLTNYILFPDLSQIWTQVTYDVSRPTAVGSASARYRGPPGPPGRQELVEAAEVYGAQVALFAENAERSGRHVARGECWDMANEALKAFPAAQLGVPPPLTSISRTHGIRLYHGAASAKGVGAGAWEQPDDLGGIRRGDIIEWRLVACETVNPTLSCTLGDPDHTAVIVDASGSTLAHPLHCPPHQLGLITVVEQSLAQIPVRRTYNLATISRGQVWIYRPMAEQSLLGPGANSITFPPPHPSFQA